MERNWDRLLSQDEDSGLTKEQRAEIDRRLLEDVNEPGDVFTWDEVKAEALRRAGRRGLSRNFLPFRLGDVAADDLGGPGHSR